MAGGRAAIPIHTRPSGVTVSPFGAFPVGNVFTAKLTGSTRETVPARQFPTQADPAPKARAPEPSPVRTKPLWLPSVSVKR